MENIKEIIKDIDEQTWTTHDVVELFNALLRQQCIIAGMLVTEDDIKNVARDIYSEELSDERMEKVKNFIRDEGSMFLGSVSDRVSSAIRNALENAVYKEGRVTRVREFLKDHQAQGYSENLMAMFMVDLTEVINWLYDCPHTYSLYELRSPEDAIEIFFSFAPDEITQDANKKEYRFSCTAGSTAAESTAHMIFRFPTEGEPSVHIKIKGDENAFGYDNRDALTCLYEDMLERVMYFQNSFPELYRYASGIHDKNALAVVSTIQTDDIVWRISREKKILAH